MSDADPPPFTIQKVVIGSKSKAREGGQDTVRVTISLKHRVWLNVKLGDYVSMEPALIEGEHVLKIRKLPLGE